MTNKNDHVCHIQSSALSPFPENDQIKSRSRPILLVRNVNSSDMAGCGDDERSSDKHTTTGGNTVSSIGVEGTQLVREPRHII